MRKLAVRLQLFEDGDVKGEPFETITLRNIPVDFFVSRVTDALTQVDLRFMTTPLENSLDYQRGVRAGLRQASLIVRQTFGGIHEFLEMEVMNDKSDAVATRTDDNIRDVGAVIGSELIDDAARNKQSG